VLPPLEALPLAAALLAAGPRGVPPPYIMYPIWSNTFIQLYSNPSPLTMLDQSKTFF
jgi:hypothetical protein